MSFVASFKNVQPSPRFDGNPWTHVRIEDALESTGPFTDVETQALAAETEGTPEEPEQRNITTTHGTVEAGWYKLTFIDAAGAEDTPQLLQWPPVQFSNNPVPTLSEMRARSKLLANRYPSPSGNAALLALMLDALPLLSRLTGRNIGVVSEAGGKSEMERLVEEELSQGDIWEGWNFSGEGLAGEEWLRRLMPVPASLVQVSKRAVTLKCERLSVGGSVRSRIEAHNTGLLRTMSAGPYSEGRMTVGDVRKLMMFDPDPQLDECLRLLITEDAWGVFLYMTTGQQIPAAALTPIDGLKVPGGYETPYSDHWFSLY